LNNDVQHIDALSKVGDVQVAFGIFIRFMRRPYYLCHFFPPLLDFQRQLTSYYLTLIHVFGRLLRLGSLECLEAILIRQQASLPISKGGIGLVSAIIFF